jgi:hypothetical protein
VTEPAAVASLAQPQRSPRTTLEGVTGRVRAVERRAIVKGSRATDSSLRSGEALSAGGGAAGGALAGLAACTGDAL